jgi:phage-related protein
VGRLLRELPLEDRKITGADIKEVQFGWPLGMPLVRKMEKDLREVHVHLERRIFRVLFTVIGSNMVLLHAFIKKSQDTPMADMGIARTRKDQLQEAWLENQHIGSDFDDFLKEDGILDVLVKSPKTVIPAKAGIHK